MHPQIRVVPAIGHAQSPAASASAALTTSATEKPISAEQKHYEALKDERIRREKWVVMNDLRSAVNNAISRCDAEQEYLSSTKIYSKNNLAGATRDVSISQEMTAAAACRNRVRVKEKELENAEKLCQEIKCIPAY
ncbi:MAG: hypothetical protein KA740_14440 [Rhodoferax sp.]|nr:hypothetical protein [Rhodoferax sp.]